MSVSGTLSTFDVRGWVTQTAEGAASAIRSIGPIEKCQHRGIIICRSSGPSNNESLCQVAGLVGASRGDTDELCVCVCVRACVRACVHSSASRGDTDGCGEEAAALSATGTATASTAAGAARVGGVEGGEERGTGGGEVRGDGGAMNVVEVEVDMREVRGEMPEDLNIDDMDLVCWKDLSQTGLRYLKSGKFNITTVSVLALPLYRKFERRSTERLYHLSASSHSRIEYAMFVILHCAVVCCQYYNIVYAQYRYDFRALGAAQLQARQELGHLLLTVHLSAAALLALVLCWTIARRQVHSAVTAACVLGLQYGWMACCVYISCARLNNRDGWLLAWTFYQTLNELMLLPQRRSLRLQWLLTTTLGFTTMCFVLLVLKPHYKTEGVAKILALFFAASCYVRYAQLRQEYLCRRNWRLIRLLLIENRAMRLLVQNLLPFDIATAFYHSTNGGGAANAVGSVAGDVADSISGDGVDRAVWSLNSAGDDSAVGICNAEEEEEGFDRSNHKHVFETNTSTSSSGDVGGGLQSPMGSVCALTKLLDIYAVRRVIVVQLDICKWTHLASTVQVYHSP
jgi:hypothetical protein